MIKRVLVPLLLVAGCATREPKASVPTPHVAASPHVTPEDAQEPSGSKAGREYLDAMTTWRLSFPARDIEGMARARERLAKLVAQTPSPSLRWMIDLGKMHSELGENRDADSVFSRAFAVAESQHDRAEVGVGWAEHALRNEEYLPAIELSKEIRSQEEFVCVGNGIRAVAAKAIGKTDQLRRAATEMTLAKCSGPYTALVGGLLDLERGDLTAARREFQSEIELDPSSFSAKVAQRYLSETH